MQTAQQRAPVREQSLLGKESATTPWDVVLERLEHPDTPQTTWLATVRPDGRPHLMPVISFWIDGAFHVVVAERTQKGRNLAADGRCTIGIGSMQRLPSLDVIAECRAEPISEEHEVRRIAAHLGANNWPLEARGAEVHGPHAPTAGPPPYRIYRLVPTRVFGLPGMQGMEQFDESERPKPTRWDFAAD